MNFSIAIGTVIMLSGIIVLLLNKLIVKIDYFTKGVYEKVLPLNKKINDMVYSKNPKDDLRIMAIAGGIFIIVAGLSLVIKGVWEIVL
jgi:hypothetical protein